MQNFAAIDFETANYHRTSVCDDCDEINIIIQ